MTGLFAILSLGFFLGMRHATDPDHVIAVTTIVARQRSAGGAAVIGMAWGVGHTLTMLMVGTGIIVFGWVIPPRIGLSTELSVGVMLILLGVMNLTGVGRYLRASLAALGPSPPADGHPPGAVNVPHAHVHTHMHTHMHTHVHAHGDYVHVHAHGHDPDVHPHRSSETPVDWLDRHFGALGPYRLVRPLLVGVVHGLAGSAAVALLVLTTIREPHQAILYLLVFGLGTIAGMMLMTAVIVLPFTYTNKQFTRLNEGLRIVSGVLSLGFGLFIAYRIGIADGLFTGHPRWTPE